jgi:S-adenosylmethionine decarboxylase
MSEANEKLMLQGQHLLADLFGVEGGKLKDPALIVKLLKESAIAANLKPSGEPFLGQFGHDNCTGSIYLEDSRSRVCFTSYPDSNYLAIDIFISGDSDCEKMFSLLIETFAPQMVRKTTISRGIQV